MGLHSGGLNIGRMFASEICVCVCVCCVCVCEGGRGERGLIFGMAYFRGWERGVGLLLEFYGNLL